MNTITINNTSFHQIIPPDDDKNVREHCYQKILMFFGKFFTGGTQYEFCRLMRLLSIYVSFFIYMVFTYSGFFSDI